MKSSKFFRSVALTVLLTAPAAIFAQKNQSVYYYPVKSAHIEYVQTGNTTGTESYYMDKNGRISARYSDLTTKSFGSTTKTKQIVIQKDSIVYSIDPDKKTGVKQTIHIDPKDVEKWADTAEEIYEDLGFKKTGEGEVLGKKCDIWEGMSSKIWIWQGLALKSEISIFGKTVIEAKSVEVGGSIDKSKFEIPEGITWTEMNFSTSDPIFDSIGKGIEKGIQDLKDMFGPKKKK
jgi:hypothetical protein